MTYNEKFADWMINAKTFKELKKHIKQNIENVEDFETLEDLEQYGVMIFTGWQALETHLCNEFQEMYGIPDQAMDYFDIEGFIRDRTIGHEMVIIKYNNGNKVAKYIVIYHS